ncbi:MAG: sigma 54-interacting transcriptional regulator [candidate division NC10 bacterium]
MTQDRRRHPRAGVELDATVEARSSVWQGRTLNLSPYGAKIASPATSVTLPRGTSVTIRFPLPDQDPLSLIANVERMDPDGMALSFNGLGDQNFQRLMALVDSHRALPKYPPLLGFTPAMQAVQEIIKQVADTSTTVLIRGESGVGKELVARALHAASPRHARPFVKVNCAALPAELLESELFGHEKGAFTGAYRRKLGKFEFANKGTLFLDEIGELPLALQAKLLHVLQDQEFSRVGGRELIRVDTRILASTNRNLEVALAAGQFREDLYYRLNVVEIRVPPLRERREEIPILVGVFLEEFQRQYGRKVVLPPEAIRCFTEYPWPGNVRELENLMKRLVVLGNVGKIQEELLSGLRNHDGNGSKGAGADETPNPPAQPEPSVGLRELGRRAARAAERKAIEEVLEQVRWNRSEAARVLKVSYKTLLTKITQCGLASKQRKQKGSP